MNRPEKWDSGVTAGSKVRAVAREALSARLDSVVKVLKRAAKKSERRAERVHKLRTSCRRAAAAVEVFRPLLAKKDTKWILRRLKEIRQVAGEVRDLDVILEQTAEHSFLAARLEKERGKVARPLAKLRKELKKKDGWDKRQKRLVRNIKQPKERLGEWGQVRMQEQAKALAALAEKNLADLAAAHEFRIAGKELRYVLEIVGGALPLAAASLHASLGDLQQRIGVVCDQRAAEAMYEDLLKDVKRSQRASLQVALGKARRAKVKSHQRFLQWWTPRRRKTFRILLVQAGLL